MADQTLHIRSFRVVFELERRIHRIDRFRVPLPYGLPLKSIGYAIAALGAVLILGRLPLTGDVLSGLPAPARFVLLPVGVSYALSRLRLDGRSAYSAAVAWARYRSAPRTLAAFRPVASAREVALLDVTCVTGSSAPGRGRRRIWRRRPEEPLPLRTAGGALTGQQLVLGGGEQLVIW